MLTTIPVKSDTKRKLEAMKGKRTWDDFLEELSNTVRLGNRAKYRKRIERLLEMSSEEVRIRRWAREY